MNFKFNFNDLIFLKFFQKNKNLEEIMKFMINNKFVKARKLFFAKKYQTFYKIFFYGKSNLNFLYFAILTNILNMREFFVSFIKKN